MRQSTHNRLVLNALLSSEHWWLVLGTLGVAFVGLVLGAPLILTPVFLFGYALWLLYRMARIVRWIQSGGDRASAPPTVGLMNQLVELMHREKQYSQRQKARYRATLGQFNTLAAELPDATLVLDEMRQIRWANPASHLLLNVHPETDRGQRIDNLVRDPQLHEFLNSPGKADEIEISSPVDPDRVLALRTVLSDTGMIVLLARDITQRVTTREMRKAFVADVSHELRSPLTVIQGYLEMLHEDDTLPPRLQGMLQKITGQSDRMRHIIENLLELSRLESQVLEPDEGDPVAMAPLLHAQIDVVEEELGVGHNFLRDIDPMLALSGREAELYSACNNLLINAVNYTDRDTNITVRWARDAQQHPVLEVSDNGAGIEPRHLPRLSERFYRVDKSRSRDRGGTGLGLAIVKHAVQRHGGQLRIESRPGEGARFLMRFPVQRALNGQAMEPVSAQQPGRTDSPARASQ